LKVCTFFGHKNTPEHIYDRLKLEIINLINGGVKNFLVGNTGTFDALARKALNEVSLQYEIKFYIVLASMPKDTLVPENSLLPNNFENFPPKFAIDRRNEYMLNKSDFVICYVTHHFGGAGKFMEKAIKKNKKVINIADK